MKPLQALPGSAGIPAGLQSSPATLGGRLFFRFGGTLWTSDGSVAGTHPLRDQLPGGTLVLAAGTQTLYAAAGYQNAGGPQTLWAIDPATLAASPLGSFHQIAGGTVDTTLGSVVENTLLFQTSDPQDRMEWWITDGTPASTHRAKAPPGIPAVAGVFTLGSRRYFTACETEHGCELWSTDRLGENTGIVQDLWPGPQGSNPEILYTGEDTIWFAATEPSTGREVWRIDLP